MKKTIICITTTLALLISVSASAATVEYSGSQIIGVSGLTVDGQIYDAIFYDGTYERLLVDYPAPGYDTNYSSTFAESATRALYGFAVTDSGFSGVSAVNITGCGSTSCYLSTTVLQNSLNAWSFNYQGASNTTPQYFGFHIYPYDQTTTLTQVVWQEASVVPIPAAAWLFGSALLGLGLVKRKQA